MGARRGGRRLRATPFTIRRARHHEGDNNSRPRDTLFFTIGPKVGNVRVFAVRFVNRRTRHLTRTLVIGGFTLTRGLSELSGVKVVRRTRGVVVDSSNLLLNNGIFIWVHGKVTN